MIVYTYSHKSRKRTDVVKLLDTLNLRFVKFITLLF